MDQPAWQIWTIALIGGVLTAALNGWVWALVAVAWLVWVVPPATTFLQRRSLRLVKTGLPGTMLLIRWSVWLITFALIVLFRDWNHMFAAAWALLLGR